MAFAACCWVGRLPFGRSPSSLNRGMAHRFWRLLKHCIRFRYPEPRRRVCCCWLSTCACPGMALLARNHPLAGAREPERGRPAAGNRTNGQFQVLLSPLSPPRGRVVSQPLSNQDPDRPSLSSLSLPLADQGPQYRGGQSGRSSRPLVCKVWYQTAAGQGWKLMFTTPRWSIPRRATACFGLQVAGRLLCLRMVRVRGSSETITPGRGTRC